tara:strand:+ start:6175 stop:6930 length:756 start_codon:yes stop_codon:yes gene_type:complete
MYFRKVSYPKDQQADDPSALWQEMQRIRTHLAEVDQNNVDKDTIGKSLIVAPNSTDHNGISDIVGADHTFLYEEKKKASSDPIKELRNKHDGHWYDLGRKGLRLKAVSRGDAKWIVGVSLSAVISDIDRVKTDTRSAHLDAEFTESDLISAGARGFFNFERVNLGERRDEEQRGTLSLKARCSQGGLSAAEAVGSFNSYQWGCSIATVACFDVRGGPVEFSPSAMFRSLLNETDWRIKIVEANIFAFGLYR